MKINHNNSMVLSEKNIELSLELAAKSKEKKNYIDNVCKMNNRIKNLKQKQNEMNSKISTLQVILENKKKYNEYKESIHLELEKKKKDDNKKFIQLKNAIHQEKINRTQTLYTMESNKINKSKKLAEEIKKNKLINSMMMEQFNNHLQNDNQCKCVNSKMSLNKFKIDKEKKKIARIISNEKILTAKMEKENKEIKGLKTTLGKLEEKEINMLEDIKSTIYAQNELIKKINKSSIVNKKKHKSVEKINKNIYNKKNMFVNDRFSTEGNKFKEIVINKSDIKDILKTPIKKRKMLTLRCNPNNITKDICLNKTSTNFAPKSISKKKNLKINTNRKFKSRSIEKSVKTIDK